MNEEELLKQLEEALKIHEVTVSQSLKEKLTVCKCKECGRYVLSIKRKGEKNTYCSKVCKVKFYNKKYQPSKYFSGRTFFCKMCGKKVEVNSKNEKNRKFCSVLCRVSYQRYQRAKNKELVYNRFLEAKEKAPK